MDAAARVNNANVVELVRAFASSQPDVRALVDMKTGRTRTFAELGRDLDDVSARLREAGVRPGDRTALFLATGIELTTAMFACFQCGAVPVLIDPGMGVANMLACIREQRPRVLIGVAKAHVLRRLAFRSFASVEVALGVRALAGQASHEGAAVVHPTGPSDVAAILYTSGSTGAPKGVIYTHGMFGAQAQAIRDMFDIQPGEVDVACFLPFAFFSIAMGMTAVFPDMDFRFPARADPRKVFAALAGATSAFASPALWEPFSHWLEEAGAVLPSLTRVLTAGAPVRPELHERLLRHLPHGDVFTPYGATEALPVAFMNGRAVVAETAALTRAGKGTCVGALAPRIDVRIIPVSDDAVTTAPAALPPGAIGEIIVRGPCVTRAYDRNDAANRAAKIVDGDDVWHRMGDVGYIERGRLWFCGRKGQRVETKSGPLYSVPVEAQCEDALGKKAALVGLGPRGTQAAVVVVEGDATAPFDGARAREAVQMLPGCAAVAAVLPWPGVFPVDRRHNAKIEREKLAAWAAEQLPHLARGTS